MGGNKRGECFVKYRDLKRYQRQMGADEIGLRG